MSYANPIVVSYEVSIEANRSSYCTGDRAYLTVTFYTKGSDYNEAVHPDAMKVVAHGPYGQKDITGAFQRTSKGKYKASLDAGQPGNRKVKVFGRVDGHDVTDYTTVDIRSCGEEKRCDVDISMNKKRYEVGETAKILMEFSKPMKATLGVSCVDGGGSSHTIFANKRFGEGKELITGEIEQGCPKRELQILTSCHAHDEYIYYVEEENEKPTARCDHKPSNPKVGETVTFSGSDSYDSDGYIDHYRWELDDYGGTDEYGETVRHTFHDSGYKRVRLEVEDNNGATDSATCSVNVEEKNDPPTARCNVSQSEVFVGESVRFDGSNSYDSDGHINRYRWDFDGDGTTDSYSENPYHSFKSTGYHRVSLEVEDNDGATDSTTCSVSVREKKGKISVSVENDAGEAIDSHIYLDDEYEGDTGQNGSKVISIDSGSYEIKATKSGYKSSKKSFYLSSGEKEEIALTLEKKNESPNANFTFSPPSPKTKQTVMFNSLSSDPDGTIEEYSWTFGDDSSSLAKNPTHEYSKSGTYIIKLTVTDNDGASDESAKHKIIVRSTWAQAYRQHKRNPEVFLDQPEIESKIQYWKKTYDILKGSKVAAHLTEGAIDIWKIWVNLSLEANPSFNSINGAITETVQGVTSLNGVRGEYAQTLREVSHLSEFAFKGVDNLEKLGDVQRFATKVASTASSAGSIQKTVKNAFQSSDVTELKGLGSTAATKTIDVLTDADLNLFQQVSFSEMIHIGADLMVLRKLSDTLQNLKGDPTKEEILRYYSLLRIHYKLRQTSLAIYSSYRQKIEEKDWWEAPLTKLSDHLHEALGTEISGSEELQNQAKFYSRVADKTVLELGKIASSATK